MILLFDLVDFILYFGYLMIGIGAVLAIGFPGKREDPIRAGIIAIIFKIYLTKLLIP